MFVPDFGSCCFLSVLLNAEVWCAISWNPCHPFLFCSQEFSAPSCLSLSPVIDFNFFRFYPSALAPPLLLVLVSVPFIVLLLCAPSSLLFKSSLLFFFPPPLPTVIPVPPNPTLGLYFSPFHELLGGPVARCYPHFSFCGAILVRENLRI